MGIPFSVLSDLKYIIEVLSSDFMEWAGYLYRIWSIDYPQEMPKDMLEQGSCEVL
jgi:hypothetical protein